MKIEELKINGFGKLEDKDIKLKDNINIIYGENESGKSTLLKFISGMFYGISKNKNGQNIPDIEKYKPWKTEEFSGKIKYKLDNNETFEVFREFNKKNPIIYNENLEDISKQFNIDKNKGSQFFYDQVGIEEDIFNSSVITKQAEVKLDDKIQNSIIQKISNILGTGEDNTSYNNTVSKLKKKMMQEVGTDMSKERPINLVNKRIEEIEKEKVKLDEYHNKKFEIEDIIESKKIKIIEKKERLDTLRLAKINFEKAKEEETKINIIKRLIEDTEREIKEFKTEKNINNIKNKQHVNRNFIVFIMLFIIFSILGFIFLKSIVLKIIPMIITVIITVILLLKNNKYKNKIKEEKNSYKEKLKGLENKRETQKRELLNLENNYNNELSSICNKYNVKDSNTIIEEKNTIESFINELTLSVHTMEIDNQNITKRLEEYVKLEEELESLKGDKNELEQKRFEIQKALDIIQIAYNKMKEEITPKFTEKLSKTIENISDGKYKNVRMNVSGEIIVENKNGEYINAENLSIGTIDQLYLSLRLAIIEEITKEEMPIILDESFAYYDNKRMINILKYLSEEYSKNQIIIFTCTQREIKALDDLSINYNLINL